MWQRLFFPQTLMWEPDIKKKKRNKKLNQFLLNDTLCGTQVPWRRPGFATRFLRSHSTICSWNLSPFQLHCIRPSLWTVFLLSKSFTFAYASGERGASESLTQTQCGRPCGSLLSGHGAGLRTEGEASAPSPTLPVTCKQSTWTIAITPSRNYLPWRVCVFLSLSTWLTWGGGQCLKIKCAQREWPGRCWAGWPCRPWWYLGPGEDTRWWGSVQLIIYCWHWKWNTKRFPNMWD